MKPFAYCVRNPTHFHLGDMIRSMSWYPCIQKRTVHITQTRAGRSPKIEQDTYFHIANGNTTHFGDLSRGRRVGIREREALGVEVGRSKSKSRSKFQDTHNSGRVGSVCRSLVHFGLAVP
ncbi:hypothetical protein ACN38_g156 [Penicillium nordicum]|uniref:Uncharacterized protein n=1 Tax=Penicillium nordicum TaxID=229535 RepID=A0A0M8PDY3_9EURO|nr:hypothetical protein ACN38_g156 [Penicillium nordicum]